MPPSHKKLISDQTVFQLLDGLQVLPPAQSGNPYLKGFGDGSIVHSSIEENKLAGAIIGVIKDLTDFGFQSNHTKLKVCWAALCSSSTAAAKSPTGGRR